MSRGREGTILGNGVIYCIGEGGGETEGSRHDLYLTAKIRVREEKSQPTNKK